MYTQEQVDELLKEKDARIGELEELNKDLQNDLEYEQVEVAKLKEQVSELEEEKEELENAKPDLSEVSTEDLTDALMSGNGNSMEDKRKAELFFQHYETFREHEFEEFLKSKGAVLMYGK